MCNDYRLKVEVAAILEDFEDIKIKIHFSEGTPNIEIMVDEETGEIIEPLN